jgi:RNA-directed DNA polymerase
MPNTDSQLNTVGWGDINWHKVERYVYKLQKRIYAASRRGDVKKVRKLQKILMSSWSNKGLSVRKVTQDNRGKKTAGVDGVKTLSPEARMNLVGQLKITGKSKPTRRVWIAKPGKDEQRPLGIPTIHDRALQNLVKTALEPEWSDVMLSIFNLTRQRLKSLSNPHLSLWDIFTKAGHFSLRKIKVLTQVDRKGIKHN